MFVFKFLRPIVYISLLFAVSCGRKGPPKPPEEIAPQSVRFLEIIPADKGVKLRFQAPLKTVGGDEIIGLKVFSIGRRLLSKDSSERFLVIAELEFDELIDNPKTRWFEYEDQSISTGGQYEYVVVAEDDSSYVSKSPYILRVTFLGANSVIENLPMEEE